MSWQDDQKWEANWWGHCGNTLNEEIKQQVYARKMGLKADWDYGHYPVYDLKGISVLDVGGGAVSMLLKCKNFTGTVVDPCSYPKWISARYAECGIGYKVAPAEDINHRLPVGKFDEAWIYNVLQHTIDPELIVKNMREVAKIIRVFEWVNTPVAEGHPHSLKEEELNKWFGGIGKVEKLAESGCHGDAYYGIFKGDLYV